jgi:hypothetical protein
MLEIFLLGVGFGAIVVLIGQAYVKRRVKQVVTDIRYFQELRIDESE